VSYLTQETFFKAVSDKLEPTELVDLLGLTTTQIVQRFLDEVIDNQAELEDVLKYGR
jgi:hypothetical protein